MRKGNQPFFSKNSEKVSSSTEKSEEVTTDDLIQLKEERTRLETQLNSLKEECRKTGWADRYAASVLSDQIPPLEDRIKEINIFIEAIKKNVSEEQKSVPLAKKLG